jgi:DNA-binding transcriptional LysR family regulator
MHYRVRYLQYFLTVAETRSFSRAAEILGISQPALSTRIQAEEERIGFPVFDRSARRVSVTEKGELLMPALREVVVSAERLEKLISDLRAGKPGPVAVGVSLGTDFPERGTLFAGFAAEFPAIPIEQQAGNVPALVHRILEGSLDAAVVISPPDDRFATIVLRWLDSEVLLPSDLEASSQNELDPASLSGQILAVFRRERHPLHYDATVGPLVEAGVEIVVSPDDSASGLLAFASTNKAILLASHVKCGDEELARAGMVRRSLRLAPVTGLMLIRSKRAHSLSGDLFWEFARRFEASKGDPHDERSQPRGADV